MTQSAINYSRGSLGARKGSRGGGGLDSGGLCCHNIRDRQRRLSLLVVTLKLLTICATLVAISSFRIRLPASPLPACTSLSRFLRTTVEDSMFFTARPMSAVFVVTTPLKP